MATLNFGPARLYVGETSHEHNITGPDPAKWGADHHARFRRTILSDMGAVVDSIRVMFGEAVAHRLRQIVEDLGEHESEAVDGYMRAWTHRLDEAAMLHQRVDELQERLDTEVAAHLATLRTLADRYRRTGKRIPDVIAAAIAERDVAF